MTTRFDKNKFILDPRTDNQEVEISKGNNSRICIQDLKIKTVYGTIPSADLGFNELNLVQTFQCSNTSVLRNQGTSISIGTVGTNKYIAVGSPYYIPSASQGGVGVLKATASTFSQVATLIQTSFTLNADNGKYSCMNKDCNIIAFTDGGSIGSNNAMIYDRVGETWTNNQNIASTFAVSLSPSGNYLLGSSYNSVMTVYFRGTGTYVSQGTVYSPGSGSIITVFKMLNDDNLVFYPVNSNALHHYKRVDATWSLVRIISETSNITSLDYNDQTKNLCYLNINRLKVYDLVGTNLTLAQNLLVSGANVCIDDTYIFVGSISLIQVFKKTMGTYIKSVNDTIGENLGPMSSTNGFLVVGCPTQSVFGATYIYTVTNFTNNERSINTIDMKDGLDLSIQSLYGVINLKGTTVIQNLLTTGGGFKHSFFEYLSSQTITAGVTTKALFNVVVNNITGLNLDIATGLFTCTTALKLIIGYDIYFNTAGTLNAYTKIMKVGSNVWYAKAGSTAQVSNSALGGFCILTMAVNSQFALYIDSGTTTTIAGLSGLRSHMYVYSI